MWKKFDRRYKLENHEKTAHYDADSEAGDKCEVKDVVEEQSNTLKRQEAGR